MAEAYYYQRLPKLHQKVYHALYTGLQAVAASISVPRLEGRELAEIYFQIRLDHPEIFYTVSFKWQFAQDASHVEILPEYLFPKAKVEEHRKALAARVQKLARPAAALPEWEKEAYIHDFVCRNVRYDKLKKPYSHEILGPLGQGVGVCEGIAKSVKILCDALGIWCMVAVSESNPERGIKYRHAWNIVKLGGQYYHLDCTFDNTLGRDGPIRYDYFNLSDSHLFRDHQQPVWPLPACPDSGKSWYREKKLSFTRMEDVAKRAAQAIRKKQVLVFHWRGGYLTREVLAQLLGVCAADAQKKQLYPHLALNWPQAVMQLQFVPQQPAEQVTVQEANEGEQEETAVCPEANK